jgi:hypothetical protein
MGGPGLATKHHWMRVPMTEFPDTTNFAACGGYRAEKAFTRLGGPRIRPATPTQDTAAEPAPNAELPTGPVTA